MSKRTIMIFPEFENMDVIDNIRKKYDPLASLVKPHITLVFPFESVISNKELSLYIKESLIGIKEFKLELQGFDKQEEIFGNYLFLNIVTGKNEIIDIHDRLYIGKLDRFNYVKEYNPHMTVGKLSSKELIDEAFEDVSKVNDKFSTIVNKISVEVIGKNEQSIIAIEQDLIKEE